MASAAKFVGTLPFDQQLKPIDFCYSRFRRPCTKGRQEILSMLSHVEEMGIH
jgi:hypothetical protein